MKALALALMLLLSGGWLRAADLTAGFEQANKLYEEGRYAEAVAAYDQLLASGSASEAIYFNRGNALFKLGQIGQAIAAYRAGERRAPRDPDLRANLQFARTQARGGAPLRQDRWERWVGALSLNEWTLAAAGGVWLFFLLLALTQWRPELGRTLRTTCVASGMAVVFLGVCLGTALNHDWLTQSAIVITGEADVRNGPLDESQSAYKIRDGIELTVLDRKDNWLQVADSAQRIGWIRDDQVLLFQPVPGPKHF